MAEESSGIAAAAGGGGGQDEPGNTWRRPSRPLAQHVDRRRSSLYPGMRTGVRRQSVSLCRFSFATAAERRHSRALPDVTSLSATHQPDNDEDNNGSTSSHNNNNNNNENDDDDDDEAKAAGSDPNVPYGDFAPVAFFILHQTKWPRSWCLKAMTWPYPFCISSRSLNRRS
jgi:hypothetical protein